MAAPEARGPEAVRARAWIVTLAAGIVLRALAAYPSFRSPLESDGTMTGLTALEILHGHFRVFLFHGVRLGALESYLHVPAFLLFGATRGALYLAPFLAGSATLVAYAFFARELLGEREGLVALLLFAVPPPMVLLWSYLPFGYAETLLCTTVALGSAVRIVRRGAPASRERWAIVLFGLAVGAGWWCSALSLMGTLPAALWIALRRPALLRSPRALGLAAAGLAVGALPWIAINLRYPLISFQGGSEWQSNFAFRGAGGLAQYLANAARLAHRVPSLLLRADGPRPAFFAPLVMAVGAVYLAAFVMALGLAWRRVPAVLLPLLVAACTGLFFVVSAAGGVEGETVRYVLPLGLAAPLLVAALWGRLSRLGRLGRAGRLSDAGGMAGDALLVLVLVVNASGYCLPGSPRRAGEQWQARSEDHLLYLLEQRRTAWVFGGYWDVYGLNFLSGERIKAIPDLDWADYHGYERALGDSPAPFALVSRHRGQVAAWAKRAGLRGELVDVNNTFEAFFPIPDPPTAESPAALIARLREAQKPEPLPPAACRARMEVLDGAPAVLESGGQQTVRIRVTHLWNGVSGAPWMSAVDLAGPAQAVRIGVRWFHDGNLVQDQRVELPRSLDPGASVKVEVPLAARGTDGKPLPPGRYQVRIGLVQELVQWFEDTGGAGVVMEVEVRE